MPSLARLEEKLREAVGFSRRERQWGKRFQTKIETVAARVPFFPFRSLSSGFGFRDYQELEEEEERTREST